MDIVRFCPGGSTLTTVVLVRVRENRPVPEMLIEGARLVQDIGPNLQEFHTRSMRAEFKSKINNIASLTSSFQLQIPGDDLGRKLPSQSNCAGENPAHLSWQHRHCS